MYSLEMNEDQQHVITQVAALAEPARRRLYEYVAAAGREVSRDEAAAAAGIARPLAAFHLDRLVEDGLLEVSFRRLTGRRGPGAGRPSKLYRRSTLQIQVSLPPRSYELAAKLFAGAFEASQSADAREALSRVARAFGRDLGSETLTHNIPDLPGDALAALAACGFEPFMEGDGTVRLRNCPFHALAEEHRSLVCGMNLAMMDGFVEGLQQEGVRAALDPRPGMCCVRLDGLTSPVQKLD